jgi:hypothetical protein
MTIRSRLALATVAAATLLRVAPVHAAADLDFRESRLQHVCKGGNNGGNVCCNDGDCPGGTCIVDYLSTKKISGTLTLVIDNDVSNIDGGRLAGVQVRSLTTILELKGKGPILAQTFQKLDGQNLQSLVSGLTEGPTDQFGFNSSEGLLAENAQPGGAGTVLDVSFLFFRSVDDETLKAIRLEVGLPPTGPELLVVQGDKASPVRFENHFAPENAGDIDSHDNDPFSSVLRAKVTLRFVLPKPPQC